jgi:hypothetical protein
MGGKSRAKKEYVHEPKEVSRQQLLNQLSARYSFDFTGKDKMLASNKLIEKDILWADKKPDNMSKSAFNMSNAYLECFFFTSYICTHAVNAVKTDDNPNEPYHTIYDLPASKFFNIVGADSYEEKNILLTELRKINGKCKVIDLGSRYGYLPPFEVHFFSKDKKELNAQELSHLANTNNFPIATINMRFLKVLYDRFLQCRNSYINYPLRWPKIVREYCKGRTLQTTPETVMKAYVYLNVFDNSPRERRNINVYEMIYYAAPGAINIKDGRWYLRRDAQGAGTLIDTLECLRGLTTLYKNILSFSLDGILVPEGFADLPNGKKIEVILGVLESTNGILPIGISRNKRLA